MTTPKNSQQQLLRLLQFAIIEIRYQSQLPNGDIRIIQALSDLFHNVPLALITANDDDILHRVLEKSSHQAWLQQWVLDNLE